MKLHSVEVRKPGSFRPPPEGSGFQKLNPNAEHNHRGGKSSKRCILTSCCASLLLLCIIIVAAVLVVKHQTNDNDTLDQPYIGRAAAIVAACNQTSYPSHCQSMLNPEASSLTTWNPLHITSLALKLAKSMANSSADLANSAISYASNDSLFQSALSACEEFMQDSVQDLNVSISEITSLNLTSLTSSLNEMKTILSGTMGSQLACSEALQEVLLNQTQGGGNNLSSTLTNMLESQGNVSKAVIVALELIDSVSSLGDDIRKWTPKLHFRRRSLLSSSDHNLDMDDSDIPDWVPDYARKLLEAPDQVPAAAAAASSSTGAKTVIVDQSGKGNYKTIKEALNAAPKKTSESNRYVIKIKAGTYKEYLLVKTAYVSFIGDGIGKTIITGSKNSMQGITTSKTPTVDIKGANFIAQGITFQNTAGPQGHQAVAAMVRSDKSVFISCSFEGYQDTLYALRFRQFYTGCTVKGTIDFIFGNAIAMFQNCKILARKPMSNQFNTLTASGRQSNSDPSGLIFQKCTVDAENGYVLSFKNYYGRPWKAYARTVFMQCTVGKFLNAAGWMEWGGSPQFDDTVYYGEYANKGAGASIAGRVKWKGVHSAMATSDAKSFTVNEFLGETSWISSAKATFQASL